MQKAIRYEETQLLQLATRAKTDHMIAGNLQKKTSDTVKWKQRFFALYQNLLFYFESDTSQRPLGWIFLESCYCERLASTRNSKDENKHWYFSIHYRNDSQRQYELRCETEGECNAWIDAIQHSSFNTLLLQKEELEQKYLHLLQILDSEKTAKLSLRQQCEDLTKEVLRLKAELHIVQKKERKLSNSIHEQFAVEPENIRKIKRVQSFIRGWLCRRRWKAIVQDYIRSPHAESMRKRNSIVFGMVECEREYVEQLSTLVSCFLRPLKMAASSKKPLISHEDVNSVFLNSETVFFLHQIFYKGLSARMEHWPTLVLGDLFDMLLPMLCIYNEYVRNHHYSLQVLAECKQKNPMFNQLLKCYESKPICEGRSLETFLTYPMHQVPRYIITLHELLAHTPHDHVERNSLEYAKNKLEELSRIMHDEVSETESIRKNLSIERMIVEGCEILLDVQQMFVRQGTLIQVMQERTRVSRTRLGSLGAKVDTRKEGVRQCFLFTKHLLITTRTSGGKLHLSKIGGKIPLIDTTIVEDFDPFDDDSIQPTASDYDNLDFKLIVDSKSGPPHVFTLVAPTHQDKAAWTSDISQCIDNLHYNGLLDPTLEESSSSIHLPQCIKSDSRLFKDDHDIRFSKILNSCKVPQIRYATLDRLLERLTDLRFLSIDFLNTFLLTYRVFTSWQNILDTLKRVYRNPDTVESLLNVNPPSPKLLQDMTQPAGSPPPPLSPGIVRATRHSITVTSPVTVNQGSAINLNILSCSCSVNPPSPKLLQDMTQPAGSPPPPLSPGIVGATRHSITVTSPVTVDQGNREFNDVNLNARMHPFRRSFKKVDKPNHDNEAPSGDLTTPPASPPYNNGLTPPTSPRLIDQTPGGLSPKRMLSTSHSAPNIAVLAKAVKSAEVPIPTSPRGSIGSHFQFSSSPPASNTVSAGVVVTSSRQSTRRSSSSSASAAFAAATAGCGNPKDVITEEKSKGRSRTLGRGKLQSCLSKEVISSAATVRVINVIRHWVSKFSQDFEANTDLRHAVTEFLEEIVYNTNLLPSEHKGAANILRQIQCKEIPISPTVEEIIGFTPSHSSQDASFEDFSVLELAEQLAYIEHKILRAIPPWEFLNQCWMKQKKSTRAPHILAITKRFNDVSKLVASEILRQSTVVGRATAIEKWAGVADICRCMHNYNSVLEITSALMNSSIYRLKKVWDKVAKQTKAMLEKLQVLVSSDGRFKNMREALHRIDPPTIPYLGFYLTDLAFIEDGTPNVTDDGLINFSKMRMIAHVIREIRHFQKTCYTIELDKRVASYLLDTNLVMDDDELYALSLEIEPRQSTRVSSSI